MLVHPSAENFRGRRMQYILILMIVRGGVSVLRVTMRIVARAPGVCVRQLRVARKCVRLLRAAAAWSSPSLTHDRMRERL